MPDERLIDVDAAVATVLAAVKALPVERIAISDAIGRAISQPVTARRTLPPWNNSAMDGYAVRSADLPGRLTVIEKIFAGQLPTKTIGVGECARIMTGAPLPEGADAVVMQERTRPDGEQVIIEGMLAPGTNVRRRGEDATEGEPLLPAHTPLGLGEAGLLWAQGLTDIEVPRRPTVSIASSGDELRSVGDATGRVIDTNSPMLKIAVERAGGVATPLGIAADSLQTVSALFEKGLESDVLITIAGASVGDKDFARPALQSLGVEVLFHRVAMKPAKPVLFGRKGSTLVFALPGNPTSALVAFEIFVRPALRALQGLTPLATVMPARLSTPFKKAAGLRHLVRVTTDTRDGALWATPLPSQTSGALASAAGASYLMSVPPAIETLAVGDLIDLIPVAWNV